MEVEKMKEILGEKVRLKVSVIGCGNAGSQVANLLQGQFPVFAINSSERDLDNRVMDSKIPAFIIGDEARGAGKNRDVAKALLKKNGRNLFEKTEFISIIEDADVIVVCGAMAGGTGSGIAPILLDMMVQMYSQKIFIYYGILPKMTDSYQAQANTLQCYDEIVKLNIPYMLGDLNFYQSDSNDKAYADIAEHIRGAICTISGEYLNYSASGMIDENDMRVILSEPGYMAIYTLNNLTQSDIDKKSVQNLLIDKVKHSPACPIARDGAVRQMGMIVNCPEDMVESTKTGDYSEITSYVGRPYAVFENYSTNNGQLGQFILILSGMSDPDPRMLACKKVVEQDRPKERKISSALGDMSALTNNSNMNKLLTGSAKVDEKASVLDKFFGE